MPNVFPPAPVQGLLHDLDRLVDLARTVLARWQEGDVDAAEGCLLKVALQTMLDEEDERLNVLMSPSYRAEPDDPCARLLLQRMTWHLATSMDVEAPDGRMLQQRLFAIPVLCWHDEPLSSPLLPEPLLAAVVQSLHAHGLVSASSDVRLVPAWYDATALRSLTPVDWHQFSQAWHRSQYGDGLAFDVDDPLWRCTRPASTWATRPPSHASMVGEHLHQRFLLGSVVDRSESVDLLFQDPDPNDLESYHARLHPWVDLVTEVLSEALPWSHLFVSMPASPRMALDDARQLHPTVACATALSKAMLEHHVNASMLEARAQPETDAWLAHAPASRLHVSFSRRSSPSDILFELTWHRPTDASHDGWIDSVVQDLQATGVTVHTRPQVARPDVMTFGETLDPIKPGVFVFKPPGRSQ